MSEEMEIFKIVKQTRDFEIEMFWKRTNYFLLLNSAVGAGLFLILSNNDFRNEYIAPIIALFSFIGCFVCLAWIKIGLGSKYWQSHWEEVLIEMQEKVGLKYLDIFSTKRTKERVMDNIEMKKNYYLSTLEERFKNKLMRCIVCVLFFCCFFPYVFISLIIGKHKGHKFRVLSKPSVSEWMHRTACFFFIVWLFVFLFSIYYILPWLKCVANCAAIL